MLIKVFSLKFDALLGGFDDSPVRDFTQDKEVLQVRDHLLIRNEIPYLILVIKYYPFRVEAGKVKTATEGDKQAASEAWKKELSDAEMPLFNLFRDWRSERCKKDGVPPYVIFNNTQLAAITKQRPQSLAELAQIEGIGKGKTDKYGLEIVAITVKKERTNG